MFGQGFRREDGNNVKRVKQDTPAFQSHSAMAYVNSANSIGANTINLGASNSNHGGSMSVDVDMSMGNQTNTLKKN